MIPFLNQFPLLKAVKNSILINGVPILASNNMSTISNSATEIWDPSLPFDDSFNCKFSYPAPYAPFHHSINSYGGNTTHGSTLQKLPQRANPCSSNEHKITKLSQCDTPQPDASNGWRETVDCYMLKVDLSRFKKEDIKVRMENEAVKICGDHGFSTMVPFPERSDARYASTKFENGVLTVNAPKKYDFMARVY